MKHMALRVPLIVVFGLLALTEAHATYATNQVVSDCGDNGGANQLRAKITAANNSGGGTITFTCGPNVTLLLDMLPDIDTNIIVDGGGTIILSGNNTDRILSVHSGATLTLNNTTLTKGNTIGYGGAIAAQGTLNLNNSYFLDNQAPSDARGGAIFTSGRLTMNNSEFAHNRTGSGGALYLDGVGAVATITGSSFHDNQTLSGGIGYGGAIVINDGATLSMDHSSLSANEAVFGGAVLVSQPTTAPTILTLTNVSLTGNIAGQNAQGSGGAIDNGGSTILNNVSLGGNHSGSSAGGIYNGGWLTVTNSLFSYHGNNVGNGGALENPGHANLSNTTFSQNRTRYDGAAIHNSGSATLINVTFSENLPFDGVGGIFNTGSLGLRNTLVAKGSSGANCNVALGGSFNLSDDSSCGFGSGRDGVTLYLGPLANNGGPTLTHMPQPPSPAIDGGTGFGCPITDQRGGLRPHGTTCDVGAVEYGAKVPFLWLPLIRR